MLYRPGGVRRSPRLLVCAGLLLLAAGLGWLVCTGLLARSAMTRVRADVTSLKSAVTAGDLPRARAASASLVSDVHRAHALTTGPAWSVAAAVPYLGAPVSSVRDLAAALDGLASSVPALPDRLDARTLASLAVPAHASLLATNRALAEVADAPAGTWLPAVDAARADVYTKLTAVRSGLQAVDGYLPLLGLDGPKRYFVGIENSAEARGLGGLPGSFAIAVVDHGAVSFTHFESDTALAGVSSGVDLGEEYRTRYGNSNGLANYQNSTMSPNFPSVARIWAGMWQTKTGEHVDGAIVVDPTALSYFLAATGPATLADGTTVSAANIVQLTESTVYQRFATDNDGRKKYLLDIAAAVQKHIMAGQPTALLRAATKAATERRLLIWTSDATVESQLESAAVGGTLPGPDRALAGVTVTNAGGNKLDYYLDRTISYVRTGCGATRTVVATVTLHNAAPATGLPAYVTNRSDGRAYPTRPGDNRLLVSAYSTAGSALQSVMVDGTPVRYWVAPELGHPVFTVDVELPRAATRVIQYRYTEPALDGPVQMLNQPLVRPAQQRVTDASCR